MIKRSLIALVIFTVVSAPLLIAGNPGTSGSKPDFSGIWTLDKSASKLADSNPLREAGSLTLTISHKDPELRIVQQIVLPVGTRTRESIYYTNGRGERNSNRYGYDLALADGGTNPESGSPAIIPSKTEWEGNKIVCRARNYVTSRETGFIDVDVLEIWKLSKNGTILTQTTVHSSGAEKGPLKMDFRREVKRVFQRLQ